MPHPEVRVPPAARRHDLDGLRIGSVFALVPYHSARIFDVWEDFYVQDATTSAGPTLIRTVLDPWGMALLFVIAGPASWQALRHRNGMQYLAQRARRLLAPLVIGLLVIVPPQAHLAWRGRGGRRSLRAFWPEYWAMRTGDVMGFTGSVTGGHLWFILSLFVFSALAWPLLLAARRPTGVRLVGALAERAQPPGALLLLAVPLWMTGPLPGPTPSGLHLLASFALFVAGFIGLGAAAPRAC